MSYEQPRGPDANGVAALADDGRPAGPPARIDPRGPRFAQALTGSLSLLAFLLDAWPLVVGLAILLATAAIGGERANLWARTYVRFVRPRLRPPTELEDPRPPRFATTLGAAFLSLSAGLLSLTPVAWWVAWAPALAVAALALLAASTGLCVGCEIYVRAQRWRGAWQGDVA